MSRLQNIHQSFAIGLGVFERTKSHPPNSFFKKTMLGGVIVLPIDKMTNTF